MKTCFAFLTMSMLLALVSCPPASARVGWDEETAIKNLGNPIAAAPNEKTFLKDGWFVVMTFSGGKCAEVYYAKIERTPISKEEAMALMEKNGSGWKNDDLNSIRLRAKVFDNGKAFAIHNGTSVSIELWSHFEAGQKLRQQEAKKRLKGL